MNIVGHKNLYFLLSAIVIVPGIVSLILFGLKFSIDFTGGSTLNLSFENAQNISKQSVRDIVETNRDVRVKDVIINKNNVVIKTNPIGPDIKTKIEKDLKKENSSLTEKGFDSVGPIIGQETAAKAIQAVLIASFFITIYIAFVFRKVSNPVSSWKFGVVAIIALIHDILVTVGIFSILGYFFNVEVDSLFITALLTIMGFSVHDTIVVFDRIRENLTKNSGFDFYKIVNNSVMETINRSLNTSLTVVLVLFALFLFSNGSIRWFVVALLIGIVSGTYSSIFTASPLLVVWYEWDKKRKK